MLFFYEADPYRLILCKNILFLAGPISYGTRRFLFDLDRRKSPIAPIRASADRRIKNYQSSRGPTNRTYIRGHVQHIYSAASSPSHILRRVDSGPPRRVPRIYSAALTPSTTSSPSAAPNTISPQQQPIQHRLSSTQYSEATLYRPNNSSAQRHPILHRVSGTR